VAKPAPTAPDEIETVTLTAIITETRIIQSKAKRACQL